MSQDPDRPDTEYDRFEALTRKLVGVPRDELDEERAKEKARRA